MLPYGQNTPPSPDNKSSNGGDTVESTSGLSQFWSELKRRKVMRVAVNLCGGGVVDYSGGRDDL